MSVSAEPEALSYRDSLGAARGLRLQADDIEGRIRTALEELYYQQVVMHPIDTHETRHEVERFGGFEGSVQFRRFGETEGWNMAHSQLRPVPAAGLLVGVEVGPGSVHVIIAETHFRCEWRFNLEQFTLTAVDDEPA